MFIVRMFILLLALLIGVAESKAACDQIKITHKTLIRANTPGWSVVRVVLLYDWSAYPDAKRPLTYPLIVEMDEPTRARADQNLWIKQIYVCSDRAAKKGTAQYTVEALRAEYVKNGTRYVWLETMLTVPADVATKRSSMRALIAGVAYKGEWTIEKGEWIVILKKP
ncbi:MAG: hypothetical protein HYS26_04335 [Candidatus Kaiserbacteria bacterium]|nr:MAG: hypothetical protein HYS26_04335 [Candidatus Kaiserbacteria bacterium]